MINHKEIIKNIDEKTLLDLIQQSFSVNGLSVNESKDLANAMVFEKKLIEIPSIKSNQSLTVYFTHDIDWIYPFHMYSIIKTLLFRKDWIGFSKLFQSNIYLKNIEKLIAVEESQNISSIFLVGANDSSFSLGRYDIRYTTHNLFFKKLIEVLESAGQKIGLHSQQSLTLLDSLPDSVIQAGTRSDKYDIKNQILTLRNFIKEKVKFHRSHFYDYDTLSLWNVLDNDGIEVDFSVGNAREVGFKNGIPRHYRSIDFINKKVLNTTIVPTILSDNAFFFQDKNSVFEQFKDSIKIAKQFGASVAILFHPENMIIKPELWDYYDEIIHICKNEGAQFN